MRSPTKQLPGFLAVCLILVLPAAAVPTPDVDGVRAAGSAVPRVDDPAADGWRTESLNKSVGRQLKHIAHFLEASGSDDVLAELQTIASPVFSAGPLRPAESTTVYDSTYLRVEKEVGEAVEKAPGGSDDLASALRPLLDAVEGANEIHVKFKVVGVDVSSRPAVTEQLFSMNGRTPRGAVEIHSSWTAAWEPGEQGEPLLVRIDSSGYQESHVSGLAGTTLFSDCTRSVLEGNDSFEEQLLRGPDHWLSRLEAAMGTDIMGHSGLAVGDVNGDGLEDLYMPQQGGLPNRLYVQNQDGSVSDRSAWAGVDWLDRSLSALLVDLDNDGDQDLVVGSMPGLRSLRAARHPGRGPLCVFLDRSRLRPGRRSRHLCESLQPCPGRSCRRIGRRAQADSLSRRPERRAERPGAQRWRLDFQQRHR
jgi:hypothetical protein